MVWRNKGKKQGEVGEKEQRLEQTRVQGGGHAKRDDFGIK